MVPVFSSYFHVSLYFAGCNMDSKMWMEDSKMQHESKDADEFEDVDGGFENATSIQGCG